MPYTFTSYKINGHSYTQKICDQMFLEFFVLIADKWRVRLRERNPDQDYIHASYAHVRYLKFSHTI